MRIRRIVLVLAAMPAFVASVWPDGAGAFAAPGPPPIYSSVSGLPDGRVYEQVTPSNKHGFSPVAITLTASGNASSGGNSLMYVSNGALSDPSSGSGILNYYLATRTTDGWSSRGMLPRGARITEVINSESGLAGLEENNSIGMHNPAGVLPSKDFSLLAYSKLGADVGPPDVPWAVENIFLAGPNPLEEPIWIGSPRVAAHRYEQFQPGMVQPMPIGGTPSFDTVYFSAEPELLPEDAVRMGHSKMEVYEYTKGVLKEAGVMPDGSVNRFGAAPSGLAFWPGANVDSPDQLGNQVAGDGTRVFFVSPEPYYANYSSLCTECSPEAAELYVRETAPDGAKQTILVSRSEVTGHIGQPAAHGPLGMRVAARQSELEQDVVVPGSGIPVFSYASSDGSHVFFQSVDRLTDSAPEDGLPKAYDFDLNTESLTYLPEVAGSIVVAASDGSSFLYEDTNTSPAELDLWRRGPNGGFITHVAQLFAPNLPCPIRATSIGSSVPEGILTPTAAPVCVGPGRVTADNSSYVFVAGAAIPGFNDGGGYEQAFRYDVSSAELTCISCPPAGVKPSDDTEISSVQRLSGMETNSATVDLLPDRGTSMDGTRIFFSTSSSLVPHDVNGVRDVYEWENGNVYLLSSGTSANDSAFVDNSESGNDVFVATTSELVQGDNDGNYDVYDARVPRLGDNPPPTAVPCGGDVCQGPPSIPQLLNTPASAVFSGLGNLPQGGELSETHMRKGAKKAKGHIVRKVRKPTKRAGKRARRSSTRVAKLKKNMRRGR